MKIAASTMCVIAADTVAIVGFAIAASLTARDGIGAGALIFGLPPLILAAAGSLLVAAAHHWKTRFPAIATIVLAGLALLAAATSFIVPLLAIAGPVCGLLIAAGVTSLDSQRPPSASYSRYPKPSA